MITSIIKYTGDLPYVDYLSDTMTNNELAAFCKLWTGMGIHQRHFADISWLNDNNMLLLRDGLYRLTDDGKRLATKYFTAIL